MDGLRQRRIDAEHLGIKIGVVPLQNLWIPRGSNELKTVVSGRSDNRSLAETYDSVDP
jgi:hypothetical protein